MTRGFHGIKEGITKAIETMRNTRDFGRLEERFRYSYLGGVGIFCVLEKKDDMLMWSHYSNAHTGFCLEFDASREFFLRALDVRYQNERPSLRFVNESKEELVNKLLTKAEPWSHEREWRILDHENGPGVYQYPRQSLTSIIMGCRIGDRDKADLIKWCFERQGKPKLYEARANKKEFKLDIVEVSYPD